MICLRKRKRMNRSSGKIWLTGLIILSFVTVSLAYVLWGMKWPLGSNVGYYINSNTAQVSNEQNAVKSAASSWSQINPPGLKLSYHGTTSVTDKGYNGSNTVCWKNEGNSGTLATAWVWYIGSTTTETDLVFNDWYNWSTSGSQYDIQTVALHEFGHWIGLSHSSTGIMKAAYSGIQHFIDNDARAGFEAMYGSAPAGPSIALSKNSLSFLGAGEDSFKVRNSGEGILNYQVSSTQSWLGQSPNIGSSSGEWDEIKVTTNTSGLSSGNYSGAVLVTSVDATNSPQSISVSLVVPDDQPPTINITSPSNGAVITKKVTIRTQASDDKGIQKVDFYVNNSFKQSVFSPPYKWEWDPGPYSSGFHTIKAIAFDTIAQTAEASISLKVDKPPEVNLISPLSGTDVSGTIIIKALASDDFGIKNVRIYINNNLKKTDTSTPYNYTWNTSLLQNRSYIIKAVAEDIVNQTDQQSITLYVLPHPPESFSAVKKNNSSVLLSEYINVLTWQPNGLNRDISKYKIGRASCRERV